EDCSSDASPSHGRETMFHRSKLGSYARFINADMDGYIPEAGDGPWDFAIDHGTELTHIGGKLTAYGKWWEDEGFPAWRDEAIARPRLAFAALLRWQEHAQKDGG